MYVYIYICIYWLDMFNTRGAGGFAISMTEYGGLCRLCFFNLPLVGQDEGWDLLVVPV